MDKERMIGNNIDLMNTQFRNVSVPSLSFSSVQERDVLFCNGGSCPMLGILPHTPNFPCLNDKGVSHFCSRVCRQTLRRGAPPLVPASLFKGLSETFVRRSISVWRGCSPSAHSCADYVTSWEWRDRAPFSVTPAGAPRRRTMFRRLHAGSSARASQSAKHMTG